MIDISYVIPCYNAGRYLVDSIQSVLQQEGEFRIRQVIIVDDFNTDPETLDALEVVRQYPVVQVIRNARAKGAAGARNTGIAAVASDWIAFHDADDIVLPGGLAARVNALKSFPDAVWVGGDCVDVDSDGRGGGEGRIRANLTFYTCLASAYSLGQPIKLQRPLREFIGQAPTNMIVPLLRTETVKQLGGFDEALLGQEDLHFYFRLALVADFVFVPQAVAAYRHHAANSTRSRIRTQNWELAVLESLLRMPDFKVYKTPIALRAGRVALSVNYEERANGNFFRAFFSALKAVKFDSRNTATWKALLASCIRKG